MGGGIVFEFINYFKTGKKKGGGAKIEGEMGAIYVRFGLGNGDSHIRLYSVRQKARFRQFPKKLVDKI